MAKSDITRRKIRSKISAIKKLNDDPNSLVDSLFEKNKDDLSSTNGIVKKNINNFTSKTKGRTSNKKNIFDEIIDTVDGFLGTDKEDNSDQKPLVKSKILKYSKESARKTLRESKQIIIGEVKKIFFDGVSLCDPSTPINKTSLNISPKSFDFINILTLNPNSTSGRLMYESTNDLGFGDVKFNRKLFENFDSGSTYVFNTKNNTTLFDLTWNSSTQDYTVGNITPTTKVGDFLDGYYDTIEYTTIDDVIKSTMLMTLQGGDDETVSFQDGLNYINRLTQKLFSICGTPPLDQPLLNNATNQITEDEIDIETYFDFDDVEGIDLDDEENRKRKVFKFIDCNNFETNVNSNHIEDFAYLLNKKNIDDNLYNTLNKTASDVYEQSDGSIPFDLFQLSLTNSYIRNLPKAIIASVLSPKMIFPISLIYQSLKDININVQTLMRTLYRLFYNIIRSIFWKFITEFWKFVKKDLLNFVKKIASKILKNKLKRFRTIILILIGLLIKLIETDISDCQTIFNTILNTITKALNKKIRTPIPGLILILSESLPGFSNDRAYMNAIERMESSGVNMGPIYGSENKFPSVVRGIINGYSDEMDENSFVKIALKPAIIPSGPGGAAISPLVEGVGKVF